MIQNDPLVSISIVNYNGKKFLNDLFVSLKCQAFTDFEVIFVDNNSTDESVEFLEKYYSDFVKIIRNSENYGFAKANNIGIKASSGKYVVLLNNDTKVDPNWLKGLVEAAENDESVGMCASKILFMHNLRLIDSTGLSIYPDGTSRQRGWSEEDRGQFDDKRDVLLPSGCAALYRREMLNQIGLFDERFFAYCEDTDLGLRARLANWQCVFVPQAIVYHLYSGYWGEFPLKKIFLIERNRILIVFKLFPLWLIFESYYYYLLRCLYHVYGIITHKGIANDYLKDISVWSLILIVFKAHVEAVSIIPGLLIERVKTNSNLIQKEKLSFILRKYAISAKEIALKG